jgi:hypothetical protein
MCATCLSAEVMKVATHSQAWLPDDSQPAAKLERCLHRIVLRKGRLDLLQRMIQPQVRLSGSHWHAAHGQHLAFLLEVAGFVGNGPDPTCAVAFPMKHLPAGERLIEIQMSNCNLLVSAANCRPWRNDRH